MAEVRDADRIAQDYVGMGHCVSLINDIIAGNRMNDAGDKDYPISLEVKQARVARSVEHLEIMVARDDWGSEDMTASNSAITAGKAYIG